MTPARFAIALAVAVAGSCALIACTGTDRTRPLTQRDLTEWNEASAERVHDAFTSGRLSATLLTRIYLERIRLLDPALKSTLPTNPDALDDAEALDRSFARTGKLTGPLHGLPVVVKDNIDVVGLPTTAGCAALKNGYPVDDAFVVGRLRAAGAIGAPLEAEVTIYAPAAQAGRFSPRQIIRLR